MGSIRRAKVYSKDGLEIFWELYKGEIHVRWPKINLVWGLLWLGLEI